MSFEYRKRADEWWDARANQRDEDDVPEVVEFPQRTNEAAPANGRDESDGDTAIAFLRQWEPEGPWLIAGIAEIETTDPETGKIAFTTKIEALSYSNIDLARSRIAEWQNKRCNCFFVPNRVRPSVNKKPKKEDISHALAQHADIDPTEPGADLAKWQADTLDRLKGYRLPPSVIILTGNGYQAYWRFDEAVEIHDADAIAEIEDVNRDLAAAFNSDLSKGDSCHSIEHLMRLPGTVNYPTVEKRKRGRVPVLAKLVTFNARTYTLAEFDVVQSSANWTSIAGSAANEEHDTRDYTPSGKAFRAALDIDAQSYEEMREGLRNHEDPEIREWVGRKGERYGEYGLRLIWDKISADDEPRQSTASDLGEWDFGCCQHRPRAVTAARLVVGDMVVPRVLVIAVWRWTGRQDRQPHCLRARAVHRSQRHIERARLRALQCLVPVL
jgi:hypothetical protein